jgi:hypothetical protein
MTPPDPAAQDPVAARQVAGEPDATQPADRSASRRAANPARPVGQDDWVARYSARAEQRNAEARAKLVPLAEGERPWPLLAAILLTTVAAAINLALYIGGATIDGKHPGAGEMIIFTAIMLVCAYGMWVLWYQAVLAFMVLLAIVLVLFALFLLEASNLLGVLVALAILAGGGFEFWKLIGVLSRLQMPERPQRG